ncbi:DUF4921 family protein [bacterium]|nr:DUF4921 family protein [bacterium]
MPKKDKEELKIKFPSELRFDAVSRDWVVIATGRARRPETFKEEGEKIKEDTTKDCPFCDLSDQEIPVLIFSHGKRVGLTKEGKIPRNWTTIVLPNKYPAFFPSSRLDEEIEGGIYHKINAAGFHEVVVLRNHHRQIAQLSVKRIKELIDVYQSRYLSLMKEKFVSYISIFHNHGRRAGASIAHPHSQIITTPLVDVDLKNALENSSRYFKKHKKCIYCVMGKWEQKVKKRIVFENKDFIVVCPFASKSAFEMIVSPKKHRPYFERITEKEKWSLSEAFKVAFYKLYKGLGAPSYNFYLHTAPCDGRNYNYYHWHFTILPKTSTWAGFELGARIEISTVEPEKAAQYLRKQ